MSKKPSAIKAYRNVCLNETHHDVIAKRERRWEEDDGEGNFAYAETMLYEFIQCRGCENICLRRTYDHTGLPDVDVDYFPPAVFRPTPKWLSNPPFLLVLSGPVAEIKSLLREVYSALHSGNNRLALMGARAVIDVALTDKLTDIGGFAKKLEEAKKSGWLTQTHYEVLRIAVDAGNAAAHRAYRPETAQLNHVLDIVENLIQLLYVLASSASKIVKTTPKRS
jgi:hypothetical protein